MSKIAAAALFAAAFIWGTSFVMMKDVSDKLPPSLLLAIRFTLGAIILSVCFWKRLRLIDRGYLLWGLPVGLFIFLGYIVQTYGLIGTTPGKNAFLTAFYCVLTPFMFWAAAGKRPDRYHISAALVAMVGICLISVDFGGESLLTIAPGDVITVACGFFYAAHIVAATMAAQGRDPVLITILQFIVAAILSWLTFAVLYPLGLAPVTATSEDLGSVTVQLLYLSVMCTAVALCLQNFGQKYAHPASASIILTFEAVFGALFSLLLGAEDGFDLTRGIGFVLMFAAILISETKLSFLKKKKKEDAS